MPTTINTFNLTKIAAKCSELTLCMPAICIDKVGDVNPVIIIRAPANYLIFRSDRKINWASDDAYMDNGFIVVRYMLPTDSLTITGDL